MKRITTETLCNRLEYRVNKALRDLEREAGRMACVGMKVPDSMKKRHAKLLRLNQAILEIYDMALLDEI